MIIFILEEIKFKNVLIQTLKMLLKCGIVFFVHT